MVNDTVGDFITRLKNAGMVGKTVVSIPYSKFKHAIAEELVKQGYLAGVDTAGKKQQKTLEVTLKYGEGGVHQIQGVKRMSKPGRRVYVKVGDIYPVKYGKGHMILSTPAGVLTGEEARKQNVSGEQLFIIW